MDSTLAPEKSPDHNPLSGQCTEGTGGDRANNSTNDIVQAIIQAFSDQKVLNKLIPAITQALHDGFIMELEKRDKTIEKLQKGNGAITSKARGIGTIFPPELLGSSRRH